MNRRTAPSALLPVAIALLGVALWAPGGSEAAQTSGSAAVPAGPETALLRIQRMVLRINHEASTPEGEAEVLRRLSRQFGVSEDSLRHQHETWGLGYGEVAMAYGFARTSKKGKKPADVVEMRYSGASWETIAKDLGVKVDAVASKMKKSAVPTPRAPQSAK